MGQTAGFAAGSWMVRQPPSSTIKESKKGRPIGRPCLYRNKSILNLCQLIHRYPVARILNHINLDHAASISQQGTTFSA